MKGFPVVMWEDSRSQADGAGHFCQPPATFLPGPGWLAAAPQRHSEACQGLVWPWEQVGTQRAHLRSRRGSRAFLLRPSFFFLLQAPFSNSIFSCNIWKLLCGMGKI